MSKIEEPETPTADAKKLGLRCKTLELQLRQSVSKKEHHEVTSKLERQIDDLEKELRRAKEENQKTMALNKQISDWDLRLASNQIEFSLLRAMPLRVGLIDGCRELGVVPLAYSPIGQGRLTGKYSAANPPSAKRTFSAHPMEQVDAVVAELRRIGEAHAGRTPSQVALAWLIAKGSVPIPGAKNREQAEQNAGALGWQLTDEELSRLDAASLYGKRGPRERVWQHG